MRPNGDMEAVTVWLVVTGPTRERIAASAWRLWPAESGPAVPLFLSLTAAVAAVRDEVARSRGVGHVVSVDLASDVVRRGGTETVIVDVATFNAGLVSPIREEAAYQPAVADEEFSEFPELPEAWRAYLLGGSWFQRGWLSSGEYLWLYTPREGSAILQAWDDGRGGGKPGERLGAAIIGGDGSREHLLLDLRRDPPPVVASDLVIGLWSDATEQASDVGSFVEAVESGTFRFRFPD